MPCSTENAALTKAEFLNRWFHRVWTEEDASAIAEMMHPEAIVRGVGNADCVGPESFAVFHTSLLSRVTEMKFTIIRTLEEGDWIAGLWTLTAKDRVSGRPVTSSGTVFAEIRDGLFIGGYNHYDTLGLYQDLELLPQDTLPRLLSNLALK